MAETDFEISAGVSQFAIDVDQKFGTQIEDNSTATSYSFAAYRHISNEAAWGAAIEYTLPLGRDNSLPGSGRLIGFRVINYLGQISEKTSFEAYAGFARYDWIKTANGYLFGLAYRYDIFGENTGIMFDAKYYQDLAYDSPQGDDIVDGFNTSIKLFYRF